MIAIEPIGLAWLALPAGYLLGAIPFGLLIGRLTRGIDIRQYGSGKVGATNTLRTLGWGPSALVFAADASKAAGAVLLARALGAPPLVQALAATLAVTGHCWSIYIGFAGGRGVASSIGGLAALSPPAAVAAVGTGVALIARTRYVSLGSLIGTLVGLLLILLLVGTRSADPAWVVFGVGVAVVIFVRHQDNIARLRAGTERRLGQPANHVADRASSR